MCDIRVEKVKLNQIYIDVTSELAGTRVLSFDDIVARFVAILQTRYQEFCSEACIQAKAREFTSFYCLRRADADRAHHATPAQAA